MAHNLVGLDHTLVGVADLEKARKTYETLGFTITPRGSHIGWGTANYCIMFEQDYIELLGIVDDSQEVNGLDRLLEDRGEGMLGIALSSDDPAATRASMAEAKLDPTSLIDLKRKLELPDGDVIPEFKLIRMPNPGLSDRSMFICHHLTPELMRRTEWLQHKNGTQYVKSVVMLVDDPFALQDYYTRLCGVLNVTVTDATVTVHIGRFNFILVREDDIDLLFPGLLFEDDWPEFPHMLAMTLAVEDIQKTRQYLKAADIASQTISGGVERIQPSDACGVLLEFVQQ